MSKYLKELKLKTIQYYYKGYSVEATAKFFNIPSPTTVRKWIKKYELYGEKGLNKNLKSSYTSEFKLNVIKYMQNNHLSHSETAIHFNLAGGEIVDKWEKILNEKGPLALKRKKCGRVKKMNKKANKSDKNLSQEELLEELEYLRMENEYLKKLNALVQKRVKQENKKK